MPRAKTFYPPHRKKRAQGIARQPDKKQVFPVATFVREEMDARGWGKRSVALAMDASVATVDRILSGGIITSGEAAGLTRAFGSQPGLWSHLDGLYREWLASKRY